VIDASFLYLGPLFTAVITHGSAIIVSRNLKPKRTGFVAGLGRLHVLLVVAEEAEHEVTDSDHA